MSSYQNYFEEAEDTLSSQISPGIVEEIIDCKNDQLTSKHVNSTYPTVRVGMVLSTLEQIGHLEKMDKNTGHILYERTTSLEPVIPHAEEAYSQRVVQTLNGEDWNLEDIEADLTGRGIDTTGDAQDKELIHYRDDYHEDTLEFLEEIRIIDSPEDRGIVANQTDQDLVEHVVEYNMDSNWPDPTNR